MSLIQYGDTGLEKIISRLENAVKSGDVNVIRKKHEKEQGSEQFQPEAVRDGLLIDAIIGNGEVQEWLSL